MEASSGSSESEYLTHPGVGDSVIHLGAIPAPGQDVLTRWSQTFSLGCWYAPPPNKNTPWPEEMFANALSLSLLFSFLLISTSAAIDLQYSLSPTLGFSVSVQWHVKCTDLLKAYRGKMAICALPKRNLWIKKLIHAHCNEMTAIYLFTVWGFLFVILSGSCLQGSHHRNLLHLSNASREFPSVTCSLTWDCVRICAGFLGAQCPTYMAKIPHFIVSHAHDPFTIG